MLPSPPPHPEDIRIGHKLVAGLGYSTVLADIDFETRSSAGFIWNENTHKFDPPYGSKKKGLQTVGMAAYSEHPSTEVICLAYNLKDGFGPRIWKPGEPNPLDLFIHVQNGGLLEAWNSAFEFYIWNNVCSRLYLFPPISYAQFRCAAAKSRACSLPSSLEKVGDVLNIKNKKLADGKRLLKRYSEPHKPTLRNKDIWNELINNPTDAKLMQEYNLRDILAESEVSAQIPDLLPQELEFWLADQRINRRGVKLDRKAIQDCIYLAEQAYAKYNAELPILTNGAVTSASQIARIMKWLNEHGTFSSSLDEEHINDLLKNPMLLSPVRRVLEIRQLIGSAAVKKLYAMINRLSNDNRMRDLFVYHTARTGRAGGDGVQPQNLPNNAGLTIHRCKNCKNHFKLKHCLDCPWCGTFPFDFDALKIEWNPEAVSDALKVISTRSLNLVELYFGDVISTISGCLRGMFIAADGHDFISSDYSSIEGVVLAALAGEEWHLEIYKTHGMMYEATAERITGTPFQEFIRTKKETGKHHPDRKIGKVASLASGYQGGLGAWIKFGADEFLTEDQIKRAVWSWRDANPKIVKMWKELEIAAHMATEHKGHEFSYRDITYLRKGDALYCRLPSGRYLTYHNPQLTPNSDRPGSLQLSFNGWNSNPSNGAIGWIRMSTYGGRLAENVTQAVARDILAHAIVNLEKRGFPVVLHVHDEIVCEVPEDKGSVEELESIMMELPQWALGWPIKAAGGWRAKRYQK